MTDKCKHINTCPCVVDICHESDNLCSIRKAVEDIYNDGYKKGLENMLQEIADKLNTLVYDHRHSERDMQGIELVIQKIKESEIALCIYTQKNTFGSNSGKY